MAINKNNLPGICNCDIRSIFKINKRLPVYCIVFHGIFKGILNKETIIHERIAGNGVVE